MLFPFIFEWVWDMSHIVFMGGLWYALVILGLGVAYVLVKSIIDTMASQGDHH